MTSLFLNAGRLDRVTILHVLREQNQVADAMAKVGTMRMDYSITTLFVVPPMFVSKQLKADTQGTFFTGKIKTSILSPMGRDVAKLNNVMALNTGQNNAHIPA